MLIYSVLPARYHASYYYRIFVPLKTLEDMGLAEVVLDDLSPNIPLQKRINMVAHSDICLFYQPTSESLLHDMKTMNDWKQAKDGNGAFHCPPSFIVDTDDDLFSVHPMNPAFQSLGIRTPDGKDLEDGCEIGFANEAGNRQAIWRDGTNGFDVKRNRATLQALRDLAQSADAVTTSTPGCLEYVQRELKPRHEFINPNAVRFDHYPDLRGVHVEKDNPNEVRILWQGSPTHFEDWYAIRHQLASVLRKYPHARMVIWGVVYPWVMEMLNPDQVIHHKWLPYEVYRPTLVTMGHDINLAPLLPTRFSSARSAIKWYEASLLKQPAATLAQRAGAFGEIQHRETGMLFDTPQEFEDNLCELIESATLRKTLGENARDWVRENRDAFKLAPKLLEFYESVRKERAERTPKMTEEEATAMKAEMEKARLEELAKKEPKDGERVQPVESGVG
jgi:hypothetical protein